MTRDRSALCIVGKTFRNRLRAAFRIAFGDREQRKNGKAAGEEANQADSLATPNDAALLLA